MELLVKMQQNTWLCVSSLVHRESDVVDIRDPTLRDSPIVEVGTRDPPDPSGRSWGVVGSLMLSTKVSVVFFTPFVCFDSSALHHAEPKKEASPKTTMHSSTRLSPVFCIPKQCFLLAVNLSKSEPLLDTEGKPTTENHF